MKEASSQRAVPGYNAATGTSNPGYDKFSTKYTGNQHTRTNPDALINKGRGPTVGNKSDDDSTYPDARVTPKLPAQGSVRDNINRGPQVRESGGGRFDGTRAWMPSAGQNYKGNADSINVGRGPTKGNQR
jgi:hypothetical protein